MMKKKHLIGLMMLSFVAVHCLSSLAHAQKLHGKAAQIASLCTAHFTRAETKYGIPKHLLLAIANTESGRYNHGLQRVLPWPWTLNVEGKGSYHDTMHDAISTVNRANQSGKKSVDVGCMQVNLKHHPHAFQNVRDALDPARNIDYAARFLRSNYDELRSWPKAIAAYHSRSSKGGKYFALVQQRWRDVRGIARGNLLEYTDYMTSHAETITGVKVNRLLPASTPRTTPTQFSISVKDGEKQVTSASYTARYSGNEKRIPAQVNVSPPQLRHSKKAGMRVISVQDVVAKRDDTVVTVTPVSLRSATDNFVFTAPTPEGSATNPKTINVAMAQQAKEKIKESEEAALPPSPAKRHQPHFIFGRE